MSMYTKMMVVQLERVAPHWLRSYFGFFCMIVYMLTVVVARAVTPMAVMTDRSVYRLEMAPMETASPTVKIVSHHHLLGAFCRALGEMATRNQATVEAKTPSSGRNNNGEAVPVINFAL
mmetsp:Transcript_14419/g.29841  ORF Transcript_14419/g.29841 Transcript_14419/m.29841 type:complete len:119 (-) Transcript_14419:610-966(-)